MKFAHVAALVVGVQGCPQTSQEKQIADYVSDRKSRLSSGEIDKQISAGTYTIDSLGDDLYRWWVQLGLSGQREAIENFVNLMQQAKQRAEKSDFLSVLFGWVDFLLGVLGDPVADIATAVSAMENEINTWKTFANGISDADFLGAAMKFRAELPTEQTTQLRAVDNFINALRNVESSKRNAAIHAAYDQVTKIIEGTASYRKSFNQYYLRYLDSANLGNPAFHYAFNAPGGNLQGILWRASPQGLDACTIANFLADLNQDCISEKTPGFEKMKRAVEIMVNQGPATGLQLSCSNLDTSAWTGCWIQGQLRSKSDGNCYTVYQQAKSLYNWPPQAAKDFCSRGLNGEGYIACGYNGFDGPGACQNGAGYWPSNCKRSLGNTSVIV